MTFAIYNHNESLLQDEPMYWNNDQGWVSLECADFYSATDDNHLPLDGQWVMINDPLEPSWENNYVQFARLLAEINGCVEIDDQDWKALQDSMDLDGEQISELFDRALQVFEDAKKKI